MKSSNRIVFTGEAGCGKSTLSKKMYMDLVENDKYGIPIYVKLRKLSEDTPIEERVYKKVEQYNNSFTRRYLNKCLEKGKLVLMLDGYDETSEEVRGSIESNILSISEAYSNTRVLVFSRPTGDFKGWHNFNTYEVCNMKKDAAVNLVNRLDIGDEIKEQFIGELQNNLFESHKDFLSNPLLLTLMLMTYEKSADVPSKMHVFYDRAFTVLYSEHDATKGAFNRSMYTDLTYDEFRSILSAFCFVCYIRSGNSFTDDEAVRNIHQASDITEITCNPKKLLLDLKESICLLLRDGLSLTFAHSSFLEYFTAHFLNNWNSSRRKDVLKSLFMGTFWNATLDLLMEMNPSLIYREYFIPVIEDTLNEIGDLESPSDKYNVFNEMFDSINVNLDENIVEGVMFNTGDSHIRNVPLFVLHVDQHVIDGQYNPVPPSLINEFLIGDNDRDDTIKIDPDEDMEDVISIIDYEGLVEYYVSTLQEALEYSREKTSRLDNSVLDLVSG